MALRACYPCLSRRPGTARHGGRRCAADGSSALRPAATRYAAGALSAQTAHVAGCQSVGKGERRGCRPTRFGTQAPVEIELTQAARGLNRWAAAAPFAGEWDNPGTPRPFLPRVRVEQGPGPESRPSLPSEETIETSRTWPADPTQSTRARPPLRYLRLPLRMFRAG